MRSSLGLVGDLDEVDLLENIEQAFDVRLPDDEVTRCQTVGDLFALVVDRLSDGRDRGDRCATAMCFYRLRRIILTHAPDIALRPSTPIEALRGVSVRSLYRDIQAAEGLRPPFAYLSAWGAFSLLLTAALLVGLLLYGAPWWTAAIAGFVSIGLYRLSPVRFPPQVKTVGDFVELVAAQSIGALAAYGARLRPDEAWKALRTICSEHAMAAGDEIRKDTLILAPRKAAL